MLTLLVSFVFELGRKVFDVISVCYCCLILLFVLTHCPNINHINLVHHFFTPLSYLLWRLSFRSYTILKYLNFWVFLCVPHLVDYYAEIADERGRNLICNRTLPSLLVGDYDQFFILAAKIFQWFHFSGQDWSGYGQPEALVK